MQADSFTTSAASGSAKSTRAGRILLDDWVKHVNNKCLKREISQNPSTKHSILMVLSILIPT